MKKTYRIGEVAQFLGISTEKARFYEREGLIHPTKNEDNGYRCYTMENIHELNDVIFYRNIDLGINEIREILQTGGRDQMQEFIKRKEAEIQQKIWQQKLLLLKFEAMEEDCQTIEEYQDRCIIRPLPAFIVMYEWLTTGNFLKLNDGLTFSSERFDLCTFGGVAEKRDGKLHTSREMILLKRKLASSLGLVEKYVEKPVIGSKRGGYTVFRSERKDDLYAAYETLSGWLLEQGYHPIGSFIYNELVTPYRSQEGNYLELFVAVV